MSPLLDFVDGGEINNTITASSVETGSAIIFDSVNTPVALSKSLALSATAEGTVATFTLTNTGNAAVSGVVLTSDNGTLANASDDAALIRISGDIDGDNRLDVDETWTYQGRVVATDEVSVGAPIELTAIATGTGATGASASATIAISSAAPVGPGNYTLGYYTEVVLPWIEQTFDPAVCFGDLDCEAFIRSLAEQQKAQFLAGALQLANGVEDAPYVISKADMLTGWSDPNGDPLNVVNLSSAQGAVVDNNDGTVTVTPNANYNGAVTVQFDVSDGRGGVTRSSFTYFVDAVSDEQTAPAANAVTTAEDTASAAIAIGASDVDGDALTYAVKPDAAPAKGTVTFDATAGTFVYTPNANANGADSFTILIDDGQGAVSEQAVSVTISGANDEQTAPATNSVTTLEDTASAAIVIGATDPDGDTLTYALKSGATPTKGTVTFDATAGTFVYTPNANANGADSFTILIDDGQGAVSEQAVSVTITPVNDAAVIGGARTGSVTEDSGAGQIATGQLTIDDVDGAAEQTFQVGTIGGAYGSLSLTGGGAWIYTLTNALPAVQALNAGQTLTDTITVSSIDGTTSSIAITINGANDVTVITNGNAGGTLNGTAGSDVINAAGGNDTVNAGAGNDTMLAGAGDGNDTYNGGADNDTVDYSAITAGLRIELTKNGQSSQTGTDTLISIENAIGGGGDDRLEGSGVANRLDGGGGNDQLSGLAGNDTLTGGEGNDTIDGGVGSDAIEGGAGNDLLTGGGQSDAFVFKPGFGNDEIRDFDANPSGGQDFIDLTAYGLTSASFASRVLIQDIGSDMLVVLDGADTIRLSGVSGAGANSITQSDFLL